MTGTRSQQVPDPQNPNSQITTQTNILLSDAADKVFLVHKRFGIGTYGEAFINGLPVAHYVEQFQSQPAGQTASTQQFASDLLQYFRSLQPVPNISFLVVGYDANDPWVIDVNMQNNTMQRVNIDSPNTNQVDYGIARGGEKDVVNRLLSDPQLTPPFQVMNLQDAVDYSRHLIRSTIDQMKFEPRFATVGGFIDTLVVTSREVRFLTHKTLTCS